MSYSKAKRCPDIIKNSVVYKVTFWELGYFAYSNFDSDFAIHYKQRFLTQKIGLVLLKHMEIQKQRIMFHCFVVWVWGLRSPMSEKRSIIKVQN